MGFPAKANRQGASYDFGLGVEVGEVRPVLMAGRQRVGWDVLSGRGTVAQ